jgi:hypothetical protein
MDNVHKDNTCIRYEYLNSGDLTAMIIKNEDMLTCFE